MTTNIFCGCNVSYYLLYQNVGKVVFSASQDLSMELRKPLVRKNRKREIDLLL